VVVIGMGMWMGRDGGRRIGVEAGETTEESEEEERAGGVVRVGRLARRHSPQLMMQTSSSLTSTVLGEKGGLRIVLSWPSEGHRCGGLLSFPCNKLQKI
jgi:hypothetical protein